jgi:Na+-driven multidrug efflux pump
MAEPQQYNSNTTRPVVIFTTLGLLFAFFIGWVFALALVVGSDSGPTAVISAASNRLNAALLCECVVAVVILVFACCYKEKLNKAAACSLFLAGVTNFVMAILLIRTIDNDNDDDNKTGVPLATWILSSLPCLFWLIASYAILKLSGNVVNDTPSTEAIDPESFLVDHAIPS